MRNSESWLIDPATKDYVLDGGKPVITTELTMPVYFRTMVPRTRWLYARDNNYGSDFWREKTKQNSNTPRRLEAVQARCIQPIIDDGRALEFEITASAAPRQGVALNVRIVDPAGNEQEIRGITPII